MCLTGSHEIAFFNKFCSDLIDTPKGVRRRRRRYVHITPRPIDIEIE